VFIIDKISFLRSSAGLFLFALSSLLNYIDWKDLTNGFPGRFHGDFHFENIFTPYSIPHC